LGKTGTGLASPRFFHKPIPRMKIAKINKNRSNLKIIDFQRFFINSFVPCSGLSSEFIGLS
jgi:isochorismate hydrolase